MIFAAVAVQNAVGMLLGWYAARFMGMSLSKRKTLAFEVGMQNSGLAVALATVHFAASPATALPAAVAALWHNVASPAVASWVQKWRDAGEKESFFDRIEREVQESKTAKRSAA